jgi:hypothetical protein
MPDNFTRQGESTSDKQVNLIFVVYIICYFYVFDN